MTMNLGLQTYIPYAGLALAIEYLSEKMDAGQGKKARLGERCKSLSYTKKDNTIKSKKENAAEINA
jgi:hypothetical protein